MSETETGGPAYPPLHNPKHHESDTALRDWVAGKCLAQAFGRGNEILHKFKGETFEEALARHWLDVAKASFVAADAFLEARK
jgi:hypothetical protein